MSGKPVGPATEYLPPHKPTAKQLREGSLSGGYTARPKGAPTDHDIDVSRGRGRSVRNAYARDRRQHHVLPREFVPFFRERGFDIDNFCVSMTNADHEAAHLLSFNAEWRSWIAKHQDASPQEVVEFADKLREKHRIRDLPYERYEGSPTTVQ